MARRKPLLRFGHQKSRNQVFSMCGNHAEGARVEVVVTFTDVLEHLLVIFSGEWKVARHHDLRRRGRDGGKAD